MKALPLRYSRTAIALHWAMALAFFAMLGMGLVMVNLEISKSLQFQMYQWHKSLGVLLLLALSLRIIVRLVSSKPNLPQSMKKIDRMLAHLGHYALYLFMLVLPLTGWLMVSSSPYGLPTIVFGWFEWPHIQGIAGDKKIEGFVKEAHELFAYGFMLLIVLHVAAVIKHRLVDKQNLLPRMGVGKIVLLLLLLENSANAALYIVDHDKSEIAFSGEHAGNKFAGSFKDWNAKINFDTENLPASKIEVEIQTASAKTENAMYDGTLPTADWFNVSAYPKANFVSDEIIPNYDGSYIIKGKLTIREITQPVEFKFILDHANTNFTFSINRLAFAIGKASDPKAEWVSKEIRVDVKLVAKKVRSINL